MSIQTADVIGAVGQRLTDYLASRTKAAGSGAATIQPATSATQPVAAVTQPMAPTKAVAATAAVTKATPWRGAGYTASGDPTADAAASAEFAAMAARARDYIERGLADGGSFRDLLRGVTRSAAPAPAPNGPTGGGTADKKTAEKAVEKAEKEAEKKKKEAEKAGATPPSPTPPAPVTTPAPATPATGTSPTAPTAPATGTSPTAPVAPTSPSPPAPAEPAPVTPPVAEETPAPPPPPPAPVTETAPTPPTSPPPFDPVRETPPTGGTLPTPTTEKREEAERQESARATDGTVNPTYVRRRRSRTASAAQTTSAKSPLREFVERMRATRNETAAMMPDGQNLTAVVIEQLQASVTAGSKNKELSGLLKSSASSVAEAAYKLTSGDAKRAVLGVLKA